MPTSSPHTPLAPPSKKRLREIGHLALPIIGGMISQNILNIVDTLMVSRLGKEEVAAVGLASHANFLAIAFITGLSAGVQAMASRRKGEGRDDETAVPLNGGLVMVLAMAVPLTVVFVAAAPLVFPLLTPDPAVASIGVAYLQVRLLGMVAVGCNFSFRGYWNGVSRSSLYLRTLVVMHACNVVISYVLIFGALGMPRMGATGAAMGTMLSTYIGTAYYVYLGRRYAREAGFLSGFPSWQTLKTMLRLSVPSGVQQLFFAGGLTAMFTIIGLVGTTELAAANVLVQIMLVGVLPGLALGLAAASLVGQALGRGDADDAERWGWDVVKVACLVMGGLGLPMVVAPELLLVAFFDEEPAALAAAVLPLRLTGAFIWLDAIGMVLLNALIGAGATRTAMAVSIATQWLLFLPAAFVVGPTLGYGLIGIWIAQIGYRAVLAAINASLWKSRVWQSISVE